MVAHEVIEFFASGDLYFDIGAHKDGKADSFIKILIPLYIGRTTTRFNFSLI
jgi:hypothetical protein